MLESLTVFTFSDDASELDDSVGCSFSSLGWVVCSCSWLLLLLSSSGVALGSILFSYTVALNSKRVNPNGLFANLTLNSGT